MNSIRPSSIFWAAILWGASIAAAGPIYTITDLGTLGGTSAQAFGISSNGLLAGAATTAAGYTHAFTSSGSGLTDLTLNTNASEGSASGVNASGQVAGTAYINGQAYATMWMDSATQSIAGAGSYAMAINNSGQVAGMLTSDGQGHAFVTENGSLVDMGTLPGGTWSSAYGINDQGDVAGYGQIANGDFRGLVWIPGVGYRQLGTLGGANSYAMAINDAGELAGSAQTEAGYSNAFVDAGGIMTDLGTLGGSSSYGYGINSDGDVVGYSYVSGSDLTHAFLYENGVLYDLNSLISAPGWTITQAYAINGTDEIAATAMLNGVEHAVLLIDPPGPASYTQNSDAVAAPEPSTALLALAGLVFIVLSRLRPLRRRPARQRAPLR